MKKYRPFLLEAAQLRQSALGMIRNYQADAEAEALALADRMKAKGDLFGENCWRQIAKEIAHTTAS